MTVQAFPLRVRAALAWSVFALAAVGWASAGPAVTSAGGVSRSAEQPVGPGGLPTLVDVGQSSWVQPNGAFLLGVQIAGAPLHARLQASVHHPVEDRAAFQATLFGLRPGDELGTFDPIALDRVASRSDGTKRVTVAFPVRAPGGPRRPGGITLPEAGVYPVRVRLLTARGRTAASLTTYLIRAPSNADRLTKLRAALVLRLGAAPPGGARSLDATRTAVSGVAAHRNLPMTLLPTPQTMDGLASSDRGEDTRLITAIKGVVAQPRRQVLAPTYVRLDASAWAEADLVDELRRQREVGSRVLGNVLGRGDNRTLVADADLTPATLGRLRESGVEQVVVPEASLLPLDRDQFPDSLTEPFKVSTDTGVPTPALQIDTRLQEAFTRAGDPVLGAQQLLAELAVTAMAQHGAPGGVVLAPPDGWTPSQPFLYAVLDGLGADNPFVEATTVDRLFAEVPPAGNAGAASTRQGDDRGVDLVRPLNPQPVPPLADLPQRLRASRALLASYASMVGPGSARTAPFDERLLEAGSADLTSDERNRMLDQVSTGLTSQFAKVKIPRREKVTLTAREADLPLTLENRLGYPVKVVVELDASSRLTFPEGRSTEVTLTGERTPVQLKVRAPVSGDTPLRVTVRSADRGVELATSRYTVRSTAVSGVGLVLTGGATLFLLFWWTRHWRSSVRHRRNAPASP